MFGRGCDEGNRSKQLTQRLIIRILIVWETVLAYMTTVALRKGVDSLTVVRNPISKCGPVTSLEYLPFGIVTGQGTPW